MQGSRPQNDDLTSNKLSRHPLGVEYNAIS